MTFPETASRYYRYRGSSIVDSLKNFISERQIRWVNLENLFIHVPKCGGTSVSEVLQVAGFKIVMSIDELARLVFSGDPKGPRGLSLDHMSADILVTLGLISRSRLSQIETFATVRNPYERLLSAYSHHRRFGFIRNGISVLEYLEKVESYNWETEWKNVFGLSHALPTTYFLRPALWQGPRTILKIENQSQLVHFLRKISGGTDLRHLNSNKKKSQLALRPQEVWKIDQMYREDFVLGGYPMSDPDSQRIP